MFHLVRELLDRFNRITTVAEPDVDIDTECEIVIGVLNDFDARRTYALIIALERELERREADEDAILALREKSLRTPAEDRRLREHLRARSRLQALYEMAARV